MHINTCLLNKNLGNLELLTSSLEHKVDIFAVSETWITNDNKSSTNRLILTGYQSHIGTSGKSMKGGCGFFVSDELHFNPREELNVSHSEKIVSLKQTGSKSNLIMKKNVLIV